jgi:hypothetical protein
LRIAIVAELGIEVHSYLSAFIFPIRRVRRPRRVSRRSGHECPVDHESGGDPSAATCTFVEQNATRANDNCFSTRFGPRSAGYNGYFWTTDTPGGIPAGGATTGSSGDGVASPGQTYWDRLTIYSTSGPALTGAAICDKWNPSETRIVGPGRVYRNNVVTPASTYTVEYAVLAMPDDNALRTTSCGTGTWYSSVEAAGGNSVVNAVRFTRSRVTAGPEG